MAAPSYTTDLTLMTDAESGATWGEFIGFAAGGTPVEDTEYFIEGAGCATQSFGNKSGAQFSIAYDAGSDISASFTTGICLFIWQVCIAGNAMDSYANGGMRVAIGSDLTNFDMWITGGKDFGRNPYGGWHNIAVDPTISVDYTGGAGNLGAYRWFGSAVNLAVLVTKGNPHGIDILRYGRGEIKIEHGDLGNGYGTFAGIATENDTQTKRWGLLQEEGTGYLWKGLMSFGNSTNACDFRDSNRNITIDDTPKTYAAFNRMEVNNAGSRVDWTRINITALNESGLSRGQFEMIDNATANINSCVFTGMSTFIFDSNATINDSVFLRCDQITHGGADFDNCVFDGYEGTVGTAYLKYNVNVDPDGEMDNCSFTIGTAATHAIEFGTATPTIITLRGIDFSGYNASHGQNDSTLRFLHTSGTVTVNLIQCTGNISYKKEAGATITLVINPVTFTVTMKDNDTKNAVQGVAVTVWAKDGTGPLPFEDIVTIVQSGGTATVTHNNHGLSTGKKVKIEGANENNYNRIKTITVTGANAYTYLIDSGTASPATGTIKSTAIIIDGLTNASGQINDTRSYTGNQPYTGKGQKGTSEPVYVDASVEDIIDKDAGASVTAFMVPD